MAAPESGWIGVDLDGTLARWDVWRGPRHIGAPVKAMVDRVRAWIAGGYRVKIVTARVASVNGTAALIARIAIEEWAKKHVGYPLEVTAEKDFDMIELWDDRAVAVAHNKGKRLSPSVLPTEDGTVVTEVEDPTPPPSGPTGSK